MGRAQKILALLKRRKIPFSVVYSESYWQIDIGRHVFPAQKYRMIYENLLRLGIRKEDIHTPLPAEDEDLLLAHTAKYLKKLQTGRLSTSEIMALELPFSPDLLSFARLTVGGTILAAELALKSGLALHIGGGFHHAFSDHGEGFCLLNDVSVAVEKMKTTGKIDRAMVVDCDVHHGNGTAAILRDKDYAYTFSIHQMDLYPAEKPTSSMDVGLWAGDGDQKYLDLLHEHFPRLYLDQKPDIVFYLAGADPYEKDQLGGLNLSLRGLEERDTIIVGEARRHKIPVVILLAGGYAVDPADTVAVHIKTVEAARKASRA